METKMNAYAPAVKSCDETPPNGSSNGGSSAVLDDVIDAVCKPQRGKPNFGPGDWYYDMTGEKFMLILNHYEYKDTKYFRYKQLPCREGTNEDVKSLKAVFGNLGFKVVTYEDLEHDDIMARVGIISNQDHSRTSCLIVVILTHGDKNGEIYAADKPYNLRDIIIMFEKGHPTLINKPKMFFIQACRGDKTDAGRTVQYDGPEDQQTIVVPSHSDFLFMYSTVEDYLSWRDTGGSWFIQELCEVIKTYHDEYDLLQMITLATRKVAYGYASNTPFNLDIHKKKQTPETRFTLTKLVRF